MSRPRFSIIIPTRERARTLHYALRSCLAQEFDDYEIIVCDNCSSPETRHVVEAFGSNRISYVRSDVPLAMSDNWELAVSHAQGDYLTILGDDDALMRHALPEASRLIRIYNAPLIRWAWAYYKWPDYSLRADANHLCFAYSGQVQRVRSRQLINELIRYPRRYQELPMIYNSFVHRKLLNELRQRTGRIFKAFAPDVYSGFALAELAGNFISVTRPMGIAGQSSHSNGQATILGCGATSSIAKEFDAFNAKSGLAWHAAVPPLMKSISAVVAETYAQATENLHGSVGFSTGQRRSLAEAMMLDLWQHPKMSSSERATCVENIRSWCNADTRTKAWFMELAAQYSKKEPVGDELSLSWRSGISPTCFDIDGSAFGVADADAAAALIENLLGCRWRPISIPPRKPLTIRTVTQAVLPSSIYRTVAASFASISRIAS